MRRGEEYAKMPSGKGVGAMWYVYMLRCGDGSLYTGSTTDVARRLREHQIGTGAKYTRSRPPVTLAYTEEAPDRSAALRREAAIKKLPRRQKLELIKNGFDDPDGNGLFLWARVPQGKRNEILPLYSRKNEKKGIR